MLVLAFGVAAQGVLDGCLVDCHQSSTALGGRPSVHCHDAGAERDALRVAGVTSCSHDHAAWAVAQESRTEALGRVTLALQFAGLQIPRSDSWAHTELATGAMFCALPSAFCSPLRV